MGMDELSIDGGIASKWGKVEEEFEVEKRGCGLGFSGRRGH